MDKAKKRRLRKVTIASILLFFVLFFVFRDIALANAVGNGSSTLTRIMLTLGADPNSWDEGVPILCLAATDYDPKIVQALLSWGANIDQGGEQRETALMYAINGDYFETASYLVSQGASLSLKDAQGESAKSLALNSKDARMRRLVKS